MSSFRVDISERIKADTIVIIGSRKNKTAAKKLSASRCRWPPSVSYTVVAICPRPFWKVLWCIPPLEQSRCRYAVSTSLRFSPRFRNPRRDEFPNFAWGHCRGASAMPPNTKPYSDTTPSILPRLSPRRIHRVLGPSTGSWGTHASNNRSLTEPQHAVELMPTNRWSPANRSLKDRSAWHCLLCLRVTSLCPGNKVQRCAMLISTNPSYPSIFPSRLHLNRSGHRCSTQ